MNQTEEPKEPDTRDILEKLTSWRKELPGIWYGNPVIEGSIDEIKRLRTENAELRGEPAPNFSNLDRIKNPLGYCPHCHKPGNRREKSINGNDTCDGGHVYPSSAALQLLTE